MADYDYDKFNDEKYKTQQHHSALEDDELQKANLSDPRAAVDGEDPFAPGNVEAFQLITLMRVYDVLLGIYTHLDGDRAVALMELHAQGKVLGSLPNLNL